MADEKIINQNIVTGTTNEGVSTQTANPTRTTVRTVFQSTLTDLIVLVPIANGALVAVNEVLAEQTDVAVPGWVFVTVNGGIVATRLATAIVTRVMAVPGVASWVEKHLPWLAPIKP